MRGCGPFRFEVLHRSRLPGSRARVGRITTPHGPIDTPAFVPVATNACLKTLTPMETGKLNIQLMFCNTYHLLLHPGPEVVAECGGLHAFMGGRRGALITDSGGFQVFSLASHSATTSVAKGSSPAKATTTSGEEGKLRELKSAASRYPPSLLKVSEDGVVFRSYYDGRHVKLTPESSVQCQKQLGADIIIPLDDLPPYHITRERLVASLQRTHRWEERSLREHLTDSRGQAMYAVVHGGMDLQLRRESVEILAALPFDGMAIGGSVGKDRKELREFLPHVMPMLPVHLPNHLLGIGDPESVLSGVVHGVDSFDSAYPTRFARHSNAFVASKALDDDTALPPSSASVGHIVLRRGAFRNDASPIDPFCSCPVCSGGISRMYLHHLFKASEVSGQTLVTIHNMHFMQQLMEAIRRAILRDAM